MLYESRSVCVSAADGVATLSFRFRGPPINPLDAERLADIGRGIDAALVNPFVEALVIRSTNPAGFCGGFDPDALRGLETDSAAAAFASVGQRVLNRLAESPVVSVAFVEGPCLGPGLDLALACDYRLAVAGPDSWVGFGDLPTCWGGRTRARRRLGTERLTAREAVKLGLFDRACCERRGKIELRALLDRQQRAPRKRHGRHDLGVGLADERRAFRASMRDGLDLPVSRVPEETLNPVPPLSAVGLIGTGERVGWLAAELAVRGVTVRWVGGTSPEAVFRPGLARGRITPLEADHAAKRISTHPDAEAVGRVEFVYVDPDSDTAAGFVERDLPPRAILAVPPAALNRVVHLAVRPGRVIGLEFAGEQAVVRSHADATADTRAAVCQWFEGIGCRPVVTRERLAPRVVQAV